MLWRMPLSGVGVCAHLYMPLLNMGLVSQMLDLTPPGSAAQEVTPRAPSLLCSSYANSTLASLVLK